MHPHARSSADATLAVATPDSAPSGSRIRSLRTGGLFHDLAAPAERGPTCRLLVISEDPAFHKLLRTQLQGGSHGSHGLPAMCQWELDACCPAREGPARVRSALADASPYALVIVEPATATPTELVHTLEHLWRVDPDLQIILSPARATTALDGIIPSLSRPGNVAFLKRPFEEAEVRTLAHLLAQKREMRHQARAQEGELSQCREQLDAANDRLCAEVRRRECTEINLRGTEHRFEMAFKSAAIPMAIMHTASQSFLEVNDSWASLVGIPRREIVGATPTELGLVVNEQDYAYLVRTALANGRVRDFASRLQPRTGETRDILLSFEPVVLGEEMCALVAMLDVTEKHKLEGQLRQSQKMEAIGQLAAGIAHDFNNLLTIIGGHASLQSERKELDEDARHSLKQICLAAERAAAMTRQLLTFSRKQVMQQRPICINEVVQNSQGMLKRLLGETIRLECVCEEGLPTILADVNSIDQVVMNLAVNARDAMPNGGQLRISTQRVHVPATEPMRHPDARPGQFVCLTVADNGPGMDALIVSRIFEPFFTTKPQGKGTGLGLSTVYGIVKQHGGWVEVETAQGLGTRFHVFLGTTDQSATKEEPPPETAENESAISQPATILVVEDEAVLREFVTTVLESKGYTVLQAGDGVEAMKLCENTAAGIDLLLTDMVMPNGVSGSKLARRLLTRFGDLKVVYTSGYSRELTENADRLVDGQNFLPKPFDIARLLKTVRKCLESDTCMLNSNTVYMVPEDASKTRN